MIAVFADDTAIITINEDQHTATDRFQKSINKISNWTKRRKIKINNEKLAQVNYTDLLDQYMIPQMASAKYLFTLSIYFALTTNFPKLSLK